MHESNETRDQNWANSTILGMDMRLAAQPPVCPITSFTYRAVQQDQANELIFN